MKVAYMKVAPNVLALSKAIPNEIQSVDFAKYCLKMLPEQAKRGTNDIANLAIF